MYPLSIPGSITKIDDDAQYKCKDGSSPEVRNKVISGVVGAASSVTSIQVANLLRLFKIPQVRTITKEVLVLFKVTPTLNGYRQQQTVRHVVFISPLPMCDEKGKEEEEAILPFR